MGLSAFITFHFILVAILSAFKATDKYSVALIRPLCQVALKAKAFAINFIRFAFIALGVWKSYLPSLESWFPDFQFRELP